MKGSSITLLALLGLIAGWTLHSGGQLTAEEATTDTSLSGAAAQVAACADCHEIDGPGYARNPHAVLNRDPDLAHRYGVTSSCNACHGDPAAHIDSGGEEGTLFAFGPDRAPIAKTQVCLECHADAHPRFLATSHAAAGLDCTSCHGIHSGNSAPGLLHPPEGELGRQLAEEVGVSSAACSSCHGEVLAEFDFNERHRLREGILNCADCHDPHQPQGRFRLGGFKQQACVDCHTDKGGPFVFEHGSQIVEGCNACHTPHGSPNRHLLSFQSVADLCYSCHAGVPGFHTRFDQTSACTNCHVTIHGSNLDSAFLK